MRQEGFYASEIKEEKASSCTNLNDCIVPFLCTFSPKMATIGRDRSLLDVTRRWVLNSAAAESQRMRHQAQYSIENGPLLYF